MCCIVVLMTCEIGGDALKRDLSKIRSSGPLVEINEQMEIMKQNINHNTTTPRQGIEGLGPRDMYYQVTDFIYLIVISREPQQHQQQQHQHQPHLLLE